MAVVIRLFMMLFVCVSACGGDDDGGLDAGGDAGRSRDGGSPVRDASGLDGGPRPDGGPRRDGGGLGGSIQFYGQGGTRGDRVRIRIDDPATEAAGPPIDVGETDFTIELFLRARLEDNPNGAITCGETNDWVTTNIVVDRDRHSQPPSYGIGLADGRVVWAVQGPAGDPYSLCGSAVVADGEWHQVAVDRRRSDGRLRIWVDGALDASADGPDGDVSYPDDGEPMAVCPDGLCDYSDPFLVVGAEKHGYGGISYAGLVDELRVSTVLRYDAAFVPPASPFGPDGETAGLYHFDDGAGLVAVDASGASSAQNGELVRGGDPPGPDWSSETPF